MGKKFRCDAKFEDIERKVLESGYISMISGPEMRRIAFPPFIRLKFDDDYKEPLTFTILQEGDYDSKVFQIGRDLFPDFFEKMSSIPAEADIVILKVYDQFKLQNDWHEFSFGFESPENFVFMYQLGETYLHEVAALKFIESHNSSNPGYKINAPRLFDCGQLEMVLRDSKNYVWTIIAKGCFLLQEYVQDCGDSAFTQSSVTSGL
jgi:hypothetical protein